MNSLSRKLSVMVKGSVCLLSLVSVGNLLATPANAGQASARGAVTVVRPSGLSESVSGETILPSGMYFSGGGLTVTPSYGTTTSTAAGTDAESISSLTLTAGTPALTLSTGKENPFITAAANILNGSGGIAKATTIEDAAAIIHAGSGVNGLGALP